MVNSLRSYNYSPAFGSSAKVAGATVALHHNDVENIVKYLNNQPINPMSEPSIATQSKFTLLLLPIVGGIAGASALKNNGLIGEAAKAFEEQRKAGLVNGWNLKETVKNVNSRYNYSRADFLKAGKSEVANKFKDVLKKQVVVDTNRGFWGRLIDRVPGYKALRQSGFGQLMSNKGTCAGWTAVLDGAIETLTEVVPTFQKVGAEAGFKQIAKSGTKVIAGTVGWVAGDVAGRATGAAIGTLICPGIGTAIGSFIGGFIGGALGSSIAMEGARKITGKSELQKFNEQQIKAVSEEINLNSESKVALAQDALKSAESVLANDPNNQDALIAKTSAEKILAESMSEEQTNIAEQQVQSTQMPTQNIFTMTAQGIPVVPGFDGINYDMDIYNQCFNKANLASAPILSAYQKANA